MYEIEDLFDNVDSHTTNKSEGTTGNKVGISLVIIICNIMGFIELIFFAMMTDGKKFDVFPLTFKTSRFIKCSKC